MKKAAIILALALIVLSSCRKDMEMVQPETPATTTMHQLKVSADFDWKTTREFEITVKGFVNGLVEVASSKGVVYQRAFIQQNQPYTIVLTVPAYETSVYLQYLGQKPELKLNSGKLNYEFKLQ